MVTYLSGCTILSGYREKQSRKSGTLTFFASKVPEPILAVSLYAHNDRLGNGTVLLGSVWLILIVSLRKYLSTDIQDCHRNSMSMQKATAPFK